MNLPKREVKKIISGDDSRHALLRGAEQMYNAVSSTYGPSGNNVILGMPYGDPVLTRDGVTVAKRVILEDIAEDHAAQVLRQASERTNSAAGDGTTATIVLAYHLLKNGHRLIASGESGMKLKKQIYNDSLEVIGFLKRAKTDATEKELLDVATVSSGDPAIGELVSDLVKEMGDTGAITIREQNYTTLDVERVDGYYFDRGFFALSQKMEMAKPMIFVTQKQLSSHADMVPILQRVISGTNKNLVIIGDVRLNSDAMNDLILNVTQQKLLAVVIPPPAFGDDGLQFLQDIATYVGAKLFLSGDDINNVKATDEFFGSCDKAVVTAEKGILLGGEGASEDVEKRVLEIKDALDLQTNAHKKDALEQRLAKLTGKIAIVNVGGSTQTEMEELRYRVEDAIEATKSAVKEGVLTGGATMLVKASELDISTLYKEALLGTFRKLMDNASEPADYRLEQIRRAQDGFGFNLRDMTDEPIDLRQAGIYDAATAVIQTIENATSAAGSLLTAGTIVDPVSIGDD